MANALGVKTREHGATGAPRTKEACNPLEVAKVHDDLVVAGQQVGDAGRGIAKYRNVQRQCFEEGERKPLRMAIGRNDRMAPRVKLEHAVLIKRMDDLHIGGRVDPQTLDIRIEPVANKAQPRVGEGSSDTEEVRRTLGGRHGPT